MNMKTITKHAAFAAVVAASLSLSAEELSIWFNDALKSAEGWTGGAPVNEVLTVDGGAATYTAAAKKDIVINAVTYKAQANFVDYDAEDLVAPEDAKAALAIAEKADGSLAWFGLSNGAFVELAPVAKTGTYDVEIEVVKYGGTGTIFYAAAGEEIGTGSFNGDDEVQSFTVAGVGSVFALSGEYAMNGDAKIVVDDPTVPAVDVNVAEIAQRTGAVGGMTQEAVKQYLTSAQANGNKGWVNVALNIADNEAVVPQTAAADPASNTAVIDLGIPAPQQGVIAGAEISTATAGIKPVEIKLVKDGKEAVIATVDVGVSKPESIPGVQAVSVPWSGLNGEAVTLDNLFAKEYLQEGDKLFVPNGDNYITYILTNGEWEPLEATTLSIGDVKTLEVEDPVLEAGSAVWVDLQPGSKAVLIGKAEEVAPVTVAAGEWKLVANTSTKDFDLNDIVGANEADTVMVERGEDLRTYTFDGEKWSYIEYFTATKEIGGRTITYQGHQEVVYDVVIPAGTAFWYGRGEGLADLTINFDAEFDK